ncbi:hypothetical protein P2P98_03725 [Microbacterium sp. Kw_RZR3]|uniref:hypothetical protein n=1 Tax=Microbacterium sp. Kw_RZR3 TaxID=3032903 RepID=UPI0023D9849B|nr:hypothetical protein [Microbacterium sp. Kw_RZR3]MDF2045257.1 hypothetical protein [Microbacterium sp. Kw_RZR3]
MIERRRPFALAIGAITVVILLSGCDGSGAAPSRSAAGEESFTRAQAVNLNFKAAVAEVQEQIYAGEWRVGEYGDIPARCEDGYEFILRRNLPEGFSFDGQGLQRMADLRAWMTDNGWQVAPSPTYGEGIENTVIVAGKPEAKVSRLDVDMIPAGASGGVVDVLEVRATSTCEPGDPTALLDQLRGPLTAVPEDDGIPDLERPDATPLFERFTEG